MAVRTRYRSVGDQGAKGHESNPRRMRVAEAGSAQSSGQKYEAGNRVALGE